MANAEPIERAGEVLAEESSPPFAYRIVKQLAKQKGLEITLEPTIREAAQIKRADGSVNYFRFSNFDINSAGAADIARDKSAAMYYLGRASVPVPPSVVIQRADKASWEQKCSKAANIYGWPLVVKPNSLCCGEGVVVAYDEERLRSALERALALDEVALVQQFIDGYEVRVVVLDKKIQMAYLRIPPQIVGDGKSTVRFLVDQYFEGSERVKNLNRADVIARLTDRPGGLSKIADDSERITLVDAVKYASGAILTDITRTIPAHLAKMAVRAVEVLGLRLGGVDIVAGESLRTIALGNPDLSSKRCDTELERSDGVVLEVNGAPEVDGYFSLGTQEQAAVERLYERIINGLG